ncbi:hypothetical protein [Exiguobacterium undae]
MNYLNRSNNFKELLSKEFDFIRKFEVLLGIDFPILFSFTSNEKEFIGYVLEFKRLTPKLEIYFVETNIDKIIDLLSSNISLNEILNSNNPKCINLEKRVDPNDALIKQKLPKNNFYLTSLIPNNIDIEEHKEVLIEMKKENEKFGINEDVITVSKVNNRLNNSNNNILNNSNFELFLSYNTISSVDEDDISIHFQSIKEQLLDDKKMFFKKNLSDYEEYIEI